MFVQYSMPQYRVAFHEALRTMLAERGIDVHVIHGNPYGADVARNDAATVSFATVRDHRVMRFAGAEITWLPSYRQTRHADLVICDQHSSRLSNYALWLRYVTGRQLFALWGHGKNFQADAASTLGEAVKRFLSRHVHWWFAYNDLSAAVVEELGFPRERITSVQNAIDTRALRGLVDATIADDLDDLRARHRITGRHVCIFLGSMYTQKRLPYLIEACDHIRARVEDFELVLLGGGPDRDIVTTAAASRPWMHDVGPRFGADKAKYLRLAELMLVPGLIGLTILDAFAAGLPVVTVADAYHSPEIAYLDERRNGEMLPAGTTPVEYAEAVVDLLADDARRERMAAACRQDSERYTIEEMAARFASGIEQALRTAR